jgi:hypothetical protein
MVWLGSLETTRCRTQASAADRARLRVRAAGMAKVARVRNTQAVPPFCETNLDWTPLRRHAETSEPIPYPSLRAKRSNPGAGVRPSGLLAPRMLWPLDCFVARAPRNDGWVAADPIASVVIGRRLCKNRNESRRERTGISGHARSARSPFSRSKFGGSMGVTRKICRLATP